MRRMLARVRAEVNRFGLASLLLLTTCLAYYAYSPLASLYADGKTPAVTCKAAERPEDTASRNLEYVLNGMKDVILYLTIWSLTPWKPARVRIAVSMVCAWGALEALQTSACMLALGINYDAPSTGLYRGLCDLVTGLPVYMGTMVIVLLIFAYQWTRKGS